MAYLPHPQKEEGGQKELWTADEDVRILLKAILKELQIISFPRLKSWVCRETNPN